MILISKYYIVNNTHVFVAIVVTSLGSSIDFVYQYRAIRRFVAFILFNCYPKIKAQQILTAINMNINKLRGTTHSIFNII